MKISICALTFRRPEGALLPRARVRGRVAYVRACQDIASDLGRLWAALGGTYQEYRRVHGS